MRAFVIVDLGFGDAGKGLLTDFLVRRHGASWVVRYNGGAQAGHNVVAPDGRHHTFAQFGAGTLVAGVRTFLSRFMVIHPTALLVEEAHLRSIGVPDALERLRISGQALVIAPFHQAAGRLRELARGASRHGSCGVGVGEAVGHSLTNPEDKVTAGDLSDLGRLQRKLERAREYERAEISRLDPSLLTDARWAHEARILNGREAAERWIASASRLASLVTDEETWAAAREDGSDIVFEGAHGVLLDEWHGFHPYTTWCCCTTAPAARLLADCVPGAEVQRVGVLRAYAVRHGPGPLPTESSAVGSTPPEHNGANDWQGEVRRGWFDATLARYALGVTGEIDALAITHLDWLATIPRWTYGDGYRPAVPLAAFQETSIERQELLTRGLAEAQPLLSHCCAREEAVLERIEDLLGKPVAIGSRGPSAANVFIRPGRGLALESLAAVATASGGETWR